MNLRNILNLKNKEKVSDSVGDLPHANLKPQEAMLPDNIYISS